MATTGTDAATKAASILVGLEGIGILALAGWQVVSLVTGDVVDVASSIALIVLTLILAVAVVAAGVAISRGASAGRSGGIVTQVMILAIALGAATGAYASPIFAVALAIPALITFALIVVAARRAAGREERDAA